jgi:uncharacterized membrane protein YfcA
LTAFALTPWQWTLAIVSAVCIGLSKTGFGGVSLLSVVLMAGIVPARESTGVILPLLLFADCFAVRAFRQHARWPEIRRLLPAALLGVAAGAVIMRSFSAPQQGHDALFKRIIGGIVLVLTLLQYLRRARPGLFGHLPVGSRIFAWSTGGMAGLTSMLANASGPVVTLFLLALALPKMEIVGTGAWLFLLLNVVKTPFSYGLGLISTDSLWVDVCLFPAVAAGVFAGRWLLHRVPQRLFEELLLLFALIASCKLLAG